MTNPFGGHTSGFNHSGNVDDFKKAHNKADTDESINALHHTLGKKAVQAAPGDHKHDGYWVTGDVKTSYAPADNIHWFELNGQPSPTAALTALFGANLPDLRDKFIIGASGTKAPGAVGGSATKTLVVDNLPSHDHTIAHDHTITHTHDMTHTHTMAHTHNMDHTHNMAHEHTMAHTHPITVKYRTDFSAGGALIGVNDVGSATGAGTGTTVTGNTGASSAANTGASSAATTGASSASDTGASSAASTGSSSAANTGASSAANTGASSTPNTGASSAANSGLTGAGTAFDVMNPWHAMRVLVYSE